MDLSLPPSPGCDIIFGEIFHSFRSMKYKTDISRYYITSNKKKQKLKKRKIERSEEKIRESKNYYRIEEFLNYIKPNLIIDSIFKMNESKVPTDFNYD